MSRLLSFLTHSVILIDGILSRTKRQTREAILCLFPYANLQSRAAWINENIDKILSES
jgi:chitin synthase